MDIKYSFQAWKEFLFGPFKLNTYDEVEFKSYPEYQFVSDTRDQQLYAYSHPGEIMSEIEQELRSGPLSPMEILKREIKSDLDKHDANLLAMFRTIGF